MNNKNLYAIIIMIIIVLLNINISQGLKENENDKKITEITQFYESIINSDGYISVIIEITENKKSYELDFSIKENLSGIDLGFYAVPNIINFFKIENIDYNSYFQNNYIYVLGKKEYKTLEELAQSLSTLSFIKMIADKNSFFAEINTTIWDEERKNSFIDDIYKTNKFVFSYKPLKYMDTNSNQFKEGTYIWKIKDKEITGLYANRKEKKYWLILVFSILIIILFCVGGWKYYKIKKLKTYLC